MRKLMTTSLIMLSKTASPLLKQSKENSNLQSLLVTIRRRLNEAGLFGHVARKEYPFTSDHIRKRLSFGNGYQGWTEDQWDTVLFSDETHIEMGPHGQVWVQRPLGAAFEPHYMSTKVAHPHTNLNLGLLLWTWTG